MYYSYINCKKETRYTWNCSAIEVQKYITLSAINVIIQLITVSIATFKLGALTMKMPNKQLHGHFD